jgi:acyl-CoA reductase-like NAD-dependent aldehyde dehydrogenase
MVSTAVVAGVEVDTRHWIGGRRIGSAATFTDVSPIDEQPIAEIARGTTAEVTAAVSARLVAGTVWVNCFFVRDLRAPFGGAGQSGIGREGGTWSFDFYGDVKNTVYAPEGWRSHG